MKAGIKLRNKFDGKNFVNINDDHRGCTKAIFVTFCIPEIEI